MNTVSTDGSAALTPADQGTLAASLDDYLAEGLGDSDITEYLALDAQRLGFDRTAAIDIAHAFFAEAMS